MRKVVDANYLGCDELHTYLDSDHDNMVVFGEYGLIELFKGDAIEALSIIADYPDQVELLKENKHIATIYATDMDIVETLIDQDRTKAFRSFLGRRNLPAPTFGLEKDRKYAHKLVDGLDISFVREAAEWAKDNFTTSDLKMYQTHGLSSQVILTSLIHRSLNQTELGLNNHPKNLRCPENVQVLRNLYIFRLSLATNILILRWWSAGGAGTVSKKKLLNDVIDTQYEVYASYFDGFLSKDKKAMCLYNELCLVLTLMKNKSAIAPDPERGEHE